MNVCLSHPVDYQGRCQACHDLAHFKARVKSLEEEIDTLRASLNHAKDYLALDGRPANMLCLAKMLEIETDAEKESGG